MKQIARTSRRPSYDHEAFASEIAAAIWNQLIEKSRFDKLQPQDFLDVFDAVSRTLHPFHGQKLLKMGKTGK